MPASHFGNQWCHCALLAVLAKLVSSFLLAEMGKGFYDFFYSEVRPLHLFFEYS